MASNRMRPLTSQNPNRQSRLGPFAWMRRLSVFRNQTGTQERKRARDVPLDIDLHQSPHTTENNSSAGPPSIYAPTQSETDHSRPSRELNEDTIPQENQRELGRPNVGNSHFLPHPFYRSARSTAPTIATNADTIQSDGPTSQAGTTGTGLGGGFSMTEGNSVFSAPNRSNQSLTTTFTTVRSNATSAVLVGGGGHQPNFPNSRGLHPNTYNSMTANNMLTDNASVLTLASSRRHRRNSLDTNASVRALPPSSLFSTSRESLPLIPVAHNLEGSAGNSNAPSHHQRFPSVHNSLLSPDRASLSSQVVVETGSLRNSHALAEQVI